MKGERDREKEKKFENKKKKINLLSSSSSSSRSLPCPLPLPPPRFFEKKPPELPAIDAVNQLLYCGDEYGDIWEASLANFPNPSSPPRVLARTGGRPLSHALSADGSRLVLTDAVRGLLALDLTRKALAPNVPLALLSGYASDPASGAASGPVSFAQGLALTPTAYYFSDTADAPPALPPSPGKAWNAFGATRGAREIRFLIFLLLFFPPFVRLTGKISTSKTQKHKTNQPTCSAESRRAGCCGTTSPRGPPPSSREGSTSPTASRCPTTGTPSSSTSRCR